VLLVDTAGAPGFALLLHAATSSRTAAKSKFMWILDNAWYEKLAVPTFLVVLDASLPAGGTGTPSAVKNSLQFSMK
jgi:hypothetical protein